MNSFIHPGSSYKELFHLYSFLSRKTSVINSLLLCSFYGLGAVRPTDCSSRPKLNGQPIKKDCTIKDIKNGFNCLNSVIWQHYRIAQRVTRSCAKDEKSQGET